MAFFPLSLSRMTAQWTWNRRWNESFDLIVNKLTTIKNDRVVYGQIVHERKYFWKPFKFETEKKQIMLWWKKIVLWSKKNSNEFVNLIDLENAKINLFDSSSSDFSNRYFLTLSSRSIFSEEHFSEYRFLFECNYIQSVNHHKHIEISQFNF